MVIKDIIIDFDNFLAKKNLNLEGVVIGGAALNLLGIVSRFTRDCDILDPILTNEILNAAEDFSKEQNKDGNKFITNKWLNNGPSSLKHQLPRGWEKRLVLVFSGHAITLRTLDRADLLKTKLYAFCDRQTDKDDCIALKPNREELLESIDWIKTQDTNLSWPNYVQSQFELLAKELGYEL